MVCLHIGGICLCKWTAGIEQGSPSFITVKALPEGKTGTPAPPLFSQTDREREGFTLASGFWVQLQHNVLALSPSLAVFLTHTHPASGWTLIWL